MDGAKPGLLPSAGGRLRGTKAGNSGKNRKSENQVVLPYPENMQKLGFTESVVLPKQPERVISLANTPVLALETLGVPQVGIPDTKILQWPDSLKQRAKLLQTGMRSNIDLETVLTLKPDLVLVGAHAKDTYGKLLEREKIPVYYVAAGPAVPYEDVKALTLILADSLGKNKPAAQKIKDDFAAMEQRLNQQRKENQGKKVMVLQAAPPRFFLQNKNGTVGSMLELLGYTNVAPAAGGAMVPMNQETALSYEPDLIVCVSAMNGEDQQREAMEKEFQEHAAYWNHFAAVRQGKVVYLPKWFAVSGGLDELQQLDALMQKLAETEGARP